MAIEEIPLDAEEIIEEKEEPAEILQENSEENTEKQQEEIIENEENQEVEEKIEPAPKKRGRPKGSTKPKEEKPKPVAKEKPKKVAKAKPQKKKVQIESESSEEELPAYVRQQMPERDLATQMMQLLQNHSNLAAQRKKQMYASWVQRF